MSIEQLAVSSTGGAVTIASDDQSQTATIGDSRLSMSSVNRVDGVLDLVSDRDGRVIILVRTGPEIRAFDVAANKPVVRLTVPSEQHLAAAVSSDGRTVVVQRSGQLWISKSGGPLLPTGQRITGFSNQIRALDNGTVVYSTDASGVTVLDPLSGGTSRMCGTFGKVDRITVGPDQRRLICHLEGVAILADLEFASPASQSISSQPKPIQSPTTSVHDCRRK